MKNGRKIERFLHGMRDENCSTDFFMLNNKRIYTLFIPFFRHFAKETTDEKR